VVIAVTRTVGLALTRQHQLHLTVLVCRQSWVDEAMLYVARQSRITNEKQNQSE